MKIKNRKFWGSLLITLLAAYAMWWMLRGVHWDIAIAAWQEVPVHIWLLSSIGLVLSHVLRAGRVRAEWRDTLNMSWHQAWALMVRHSSWVVLVPMRGGEAIYVWALHRQGGISLRHAGISLLKFRVQDMAVLGGIALAAFAPLSATMSLAACVLLMALAIWVLPWIWRFLLHHILQKNDETRFQAPAPALESWAYAISNWVIKVSAIGLPIWMMLPIDFRTALHAALGGELAATLPMQPPAGFGPYEAGVIFGVQWSTQIPWPQIASAALAIHLLALCVTIGSATIAHLLGWSQKDLRRLDGMTNTFPTESSSHHHV